MKFYLIYLPRGNSGRWEAMSDINIPDPGAFPAHWYKKYEAPRDKYEEIFKKLFDIRDDMNKRKLLPTKERDIFPELSDILNST